MIKHKCLHCDRVTLGLGVMKSHIYSKHNLKTLIGNIESFLEPMQYTDINDFNRKWQVLQAQSQTNAKLNPNCE